MIKLLGKDGFAAYEKSMDEVRSPGLRINSLKIDSQELAALVPFPLEQVSWCPDGFTYPETEKPAKNPCYFAGLYYLQEPSAMTPAQFLPVEPGERVLDLCAAPGGKSTALGVKLRGKGVLVANDISNSRAKALLKNLELFGIPNIMVTSEAPEKLSSVYEGYFDKILIDAPCSGEGMFRKDPDMVKSWLERGPEYYVPIQRSILTEAVKMLRPGGMLLYSTCTFDEDEDEGNIRWLLDGHPELQMASVPMEEGFAPGIGPVEGCIRLFPHRIRGEGHFLALMVKDGGADKILKKPKKAATAQKLPDSFYEFFKRANRTLQPERIFCRQDCVYYLPEDVFPESGIRYLRTGLLLGELKKDRFEPSQALAMCMTVSEFPNHLNLSVSDQRVIRYLKGETLSLTQEEVTSGVLNNGWCLVCMEGQPLGFAKYGGLTLKNKYYPGWRWQ